MRLFAQILLIASIALSLACGGGAKYEEATANDAMNGTVLSSDNTYRLINPQVALVKGDYALLRESGTIHIMSADDFDELYPQIEGQDFTFLVRKWKKPYPHFRLHAVEMDGETVETKWVLGESELPLLIDPQLYDTSFFEPIDVAAWEEKAPSITIVDSRIMIPATVEWTVEEIIPEDEEAVDTLAEEGGETVETAEEAPPVDEPVEEEAVVDSGLVVSTERDTEQEKVRDIFQIVSATRRFDIVDFDEDGVKLLLIDLANQEKVFSIGCEVVDIYSRAVQQETGVVGKVQLTIFKYGDKYVMFR